MVPEARLEQTDAGLVAATDGWFVANVREGAWVHQASKKVISGVRDPANGRYVQAAVVTGAPGPFL